MLLDGSHIGRYMMFLKIMTIQKRIKGYFLIFPLNPLDYSNISNNSNISNFEQLQ